MKQAQSSSSKVAALNDAFRKTMPTGPGRVLCTAGVNAEGAEFVAKALAAVASFDSFNVDNDPHREHDFGSFKLDGQKLFWKIDYYDLSMQYASEDPADPAKTMRVLTIMFASEY